MDTNPLSLVSPLNLVSRAEVVVGVELTIPTKKDYNCVYIYVYIHKLYIYNTYIYYVQLE